MQIEFTFRHKESQEPVKEYAMKKSTHLKKYFQGKMHLHWIFDVEKKIFQVRIHVLGGRLDFFSEAKGQTWFEVIDLVYGKVENHLRKEKEIRMDRFRGGL